MSSQYPYIFALFAICSYASFSIKSEKCSIGCAIILYNGAIVYVRFVKREACASSSKASARVILFAVDKVNEF